MPSCECKSNVGIHEMIEITDDIEFEAWDGDEDIQKISRSVFRIPVDESDKLSVRVNGLSFQLINITSIGISIHLDTADVFYVGDTIDTIELDIDGNQFTFRGNVRHISQRDSDGYLCGIELMNSMKSRKRSFLDFINKKYGNVLTSSIITSKH